MRESWAHKSLSEVAKIFNGNSISASDRSGKFSASSVQGRPFISTKDVGFDGIVNEKTDVAIPEQLSSKFKLAPSGATLVCSEGGSAGRKVGFLKNDAFFGNKLFAVCAQDNIAPRFLYYFHLTSDFSRQFQDRLAGLIGGVSLSKYRTITLPLPPLDEQQRIVAVLDDAFEGLDRACAHIETNLKDAQDLSAAIIDKEFIDVSANAEGLELQSLCTSRGITYGVIKLGDHIPDGIPCLRTSNVRSLAFDLDGMKRIDPSLSQEYSRTILEGGELLVNVRGTLGGVAVVPLSMRGWNVSREVAMVAIDSTHILPEYAAFFVATSKAISWLTGVVTGATYKGINLADLRRLVVPCPSLDEQKKLVRRLSVALDTNRNLVRRSNDKLTDLEDLRQSLLQRAFAGELT